MSWWDRIDARGISVEFGVGHFVWLVSSARSDQWSGSCGCIAAQSECGSSTSSESANDTFQSGIM